jgi:hypothetical protein
MSNREDVLAALGSYESLHRHPSRPALELSGLYDLFPDRGLDGPPLDAVPWAPENPWPHAARSGVYFVFDPDLELLYVGKASQGSSTGQRLSAHFRYSAHPDDRTCHPTETWAGSPRFVMAVVAVPNSRDAPPSRN